MTMPERVTGTASAALAMPKSVSFTAAVGADQDVARLDVAVHEPALVRRLQRPRGLLEQPQRLVRVDRAAGDERGQRLAADQLHHQVGGAPARPGPSASP